jgi:hypothetical protein
MGRDEAGTLTVSYLRKASPYRRIENKERLLTGYNLAGLPA